MASGPGGGVRVGSSLFGQPPPAAPAPMPQPAVAPKPAAPAPKASSSAPPPDYTRAAVNGGPPPPPTTANADYNPAASAFAPAGAFAPPPGIQATPNFPGPSAPDESAAAEDPGVQMPMMAPPSAPGIGWAQMNGQGGDPANLGNRLARTSMSALAQQSRLY